MEVNYIPPEKTRDQLRKERMKMYKRIKNLERKNYIYFPIDYQHHYIKWSRMADEEMMRKLSNYQKTSYREKVIEGRTKKIEVQWMFKRSGDLVFDSVVFNEKGAVLDPRKKEKAKTSAQLLCYLRRNPKILSLATSYLLALPRLKKGSLTEQIKFNIGMLRSAVPREIFVMVHNNWGKGTRNIFSFTEKNYKKHSFYYEKYGVKYKKFVDALLNRIRMITRLKPFRPRRLAKMEPKRRKEVWKPQLTKNLRAIKNAK